jgi:hypothetical protein
LKQRHDSWFSEHARKHQASQSSPSSKEGSSPSLSPALISQFEALSSKSPDLSEKSQHLDTLGSLPTSPESESVEHETFGRVIPHTINLIGCEELSENPPEIITLESFEQSLMERVNLNAQSSISSEGKEEEEEY